MTSTAWTERDIEAYVHGYLVDSFLNDGTGELGREEPLLNVLDSLQMLRTVMQLEQRFGITVDHSELTIENLGTLHRIAGFVHGKLSR